MLKDILVPVGTETVTVRDIPKLFANAIYPPVQSDTPRNVVRVAKMPLTDATKAKWCGQNMQPFPVSLTDEDFAFLAQNCWKDLPPLTLPLEESFFQQYLDAFHRCPPSDWSLVAESQSPYIYQMVYSHETAKEWKKEIENAVLRGELEPRSSDTFLRLDKPTGESLSSGL